MRRILLATELASDGQLLFETGLRLAHAAKAELQLYNAHAEDERAEWTRLPTVRQTLIRWGLLAADADVEDFAALGVRVVPVESVVREDPAMQIVARSRTLHPDLLILGHHERTGLHALAHPNGAEEVLELYDGPCLVLPIHGKRLVGAQGSLRLERILVAVPGERRAKMMHAVADMLEDLGVTEASVVFLLDDASEEVVGVELTERLPEVRWRTVVPPERARDDATLACLADVQPDLVVMHHDDVGAGGIGGLWPGPVGKVLRHGETPVLVLPSWTAS